MKSSSSFVKKSFVAQTGETNWRVHTPTETDNYVLQNLVDAVFAAFNQM